MMMDGWYPTCSCRCIRNFENNLLPLGVRVLFVDIHFSWLCTQQKKIDKIYNFYLDDVFLLYEIFGMECFIKLYSYQKNTYLGHLDLTQTHCLNHAFQTSYGGKLFYLEMKFSTIHVNDKHIISIIYDSTRRMLRMSCGCTLMNGMSLK